MRCPAVVNLVESAPAVAAVPRSLALINQVRRTGTRGRQREAQAPLHPIELHVVLTREDVAQNPHGHSDVNRLEAQHTDVADATHDKVLLGQVEVPAAETEGKVRHLRFAAHRVEALIFLCAKHGRDGLHLPLWACEQRGANVHDGVLGGGQGLHVAELDAVQAHGPPSRRRDVDPSELARDVRRVDATEDQLPRRVVRQIESEDRPVELPRVHQSLQQREARAVRERREAQPQDAVEGAAVPTLDATRVADLSEGEAGQCQLADAQGVLAGHATDVTGAIGQCKTLVHQSMVRRGSAGLVERAAVAGLPIGHPQIRGASVKDHANILAGRAEADRTIVTYVRFVLQENTLLDTGAALRCHAQPGDSAQEHLQALCT
eukprot:CAMPEP_0203867510 /NCGR_PEP_ID=MMETSP0359-20131031/16559_1 /ASSEMBLY_ACC=CAM_ASM_000338 /TAXON_ID=268821 /ORGANISM="Scrippsiella Hangoei, Strain SHTV-5" /LENGTH=376 /DNA_ID=CAMNT_0050785759 /DNA_START=253 /DNA_END=1384 /DNA_ORIENTATION=+